MRPRYLDTHSGVSYTCRHGNKRTGSKFSGLFCGLEGKRAQHVKARVWIESSNGENYSLTRLQVQGPRNSTLTPVLPMRPSYLHVYGQGHHQGELLHGDILAPYMLKPAGEAPHFSCNFQHHHGASWQHFAAAVHTT